MSTVAVVTGASTGLGFATAAALVRQGWRVIGVSRDEERSKQADESLLRRLTAPAAESRYPAT